MKRRATRAIVTAFAATVLVGASACGFDAQTLQPYTQAEGVNADSRTDEETNQVLVKVRNLMVLSQSDGQGFVVGALFSDDGDQLTGVAVAAVAPDGSAAEPFEVAFPGELEVPAGGVAQLSEQQINVTGEELRAGQVVQVTLSFANAGDIVAKAPVVDGNKADYETITPQPDAGASESPAAPASAEPSATPETSESPAGGESPAASPSPTS